jgi:hypothetical protein
MKTPREILLARHGAAMPALDTIRASVIAGIAQEPKKADPRFPANFLEFLISLRWHAAAISALWLLAALLGGERPESGHGVVARNAGPPPPLAYILALREYSMDLDQANEPPPREPPAPIPHACADPRRKGECNDVA